MLGLLQTRRVVLPSCVVGIDPNPSSQSFKKRGHQRRDALPRTLGRRMPGLLPGDRAGSALIPMVDPIGIEPVFCSGRPLESLFVEPMGPRDWKIAPNSETAGCEPTSDPHRQEALRIASAARFRVSSRQAPPGAARRPSGFRPCPRPRIAFCPIEGPRRLVDEFPRRRRG